MVAWIQAHISELIFSVVSAVLVAGYKGLLSRFKRIKKQYDALEKGECAMLRNEIIEKYNKYTERGSIPIYQLENVETMYSAYHTLGGNGTITSLVEELRELPHAGRT